VQCKAPVGNHGCFNTQARARDTPIALVAGRWLLALLASGLGPSVGAPTRNLEIAKNWERLAPTRNLEISKFLTVSPGQAREWRLMCFPSFFLMWGLMCV
jgi:hypothetical protein